MAVALACLIALACALAFMLACTPGSAQASAVHDLAQSVALTGGESGGQAGDELAGQGVGEKPSPPAWATFRGRCLTSDVDGDGVCEQLGVAGGSCVVRRDGQTVYQTPAAWLVSDAFAADLDADGACEVVLLVWKQGSYGSSRPFWIEEDAVEASTFSQHIFVFGWKDGALQPVWMSSALGIEVASFAWDEGQLVVEARDGSVTRWVWGDWGFELVSQEVAPDVRAEAQAADEQTLDLLVVGDTIAHASVFRGAYDASTDTYDFAPLFEHMAEYVSSFDIAAVCQETVLVDGAQGYSGYPRFATPFAMADALVGAGFDVVLSATNHVLDQGTAAVRAMFDYWTREHPGTLVLGVHVAQQDAAEPAYVEANGIRLALFDYAYGLNGNVLPMDEEYLVDVLATEDDLTAACTAVLSAQSASDAQVCFVHCGEEYASAPSSEQQDLVTALVDAGADVVVCSHSHVLEPYGELTTPAGNQAVVFYGLGNFASNQTEVARILGGAANVTFKKQLVDGAEVTTVAAYGLQPLVCHYSAQGGTTVYLLDDYTDELASRHYVQPDNGSTPLTTVYLQGLLAQETDPGSVAGLER